MINLILFLMAWIAYSIAQGVIIHWVDEKFCGVKPDDELRAFPKCFFVLGPFLTIFIVITAIAVWIVLVPKVIYVRIKK